MALEDFVTESDEPDYHDNPKLNKEKLHEPHLCPNCGNEGEHIRGNEWRCTTDKKECETITYRHVSYKRDNA